VLSNRMSKKLTIGFMSLRKADRPERPSASSSQSSRMSASRALVELALSAIYGRWPTLSLGRSNVGFARTTDLRARIISVTSSAIPAIHVLSEAVFSQ
jgi:hypothetical protein